MVALIQTIGMRDLRDKRVFPRLVYAVALHEADRLMRRLFDLLIRCPLRLCSQLVKDMEAHDRILRLLVSVVAAFAALVRAYGLLLIGIAVLIAALTRL